MFSIEAVYKNLDKRKASLIVATGIGVAALTGCGSSSSSEVPKPNISTTLQGSENGSSDQVSIAYHPNGTRTVTSGYKQDFMMCDGPDLLEFFTYDRGGSSSRTPNYAPCRDGKLTPSDFALSPQ